MIFFTTQKKDVKKGAYSHPYHPIKNKLFDFSSGQTMSAYRSYGSTLAF